MNLPLMRSKLQSAMKTPMEAVLKDYAEELLAAVPFPVERK